MSVIGYEIEVLNLAIEVLEHDREMALRAPWEGRLCDECAWHRKLRWLNDELHELRIERATLLQSRDEFD